LLLGFPDPSPTPLNPLPPLANQNPSPSYDATIWKLLSGGTTFQVNPDADNGTALWALFYAPLLAPRTHYVPAAVSELDAAVTWCRDHDAKCAAIAVAARERMRCILRPGVPLEYLWKLLQRLHSFHYKDRGIDG